MKLHPGKAADRAGYALVLFVMIFFGLMGLAALVIDMGFARLAQRQMQTAADSAALEGLRWRDYVDPAGQPSDQYRRQQASNVVAGLFTDYVDSGGTVQYGAGPVVSFSGGVGPADLAAAQTTTLGVPPVYQPPGLQFNLSNETEGDMSSGTYGSNTGYSATELADEDANYNRRDFTPSSGTDSASAPAFLVRMRRTNNTGGLDQESDVSSGGPTLPILFGRGSMMARSGTGSQLSVAAGITVRATAIAAAGDNIQFGGTSVAYSAGRAKTAGPPPIDSNTGNPVGLPGITPFALSANNWASGQTSFQVASGGSIAGGGQVIQPALVEIGQQVGMSVTEQNATWLSQYQSSSGTSAAGYTGPTLLALSQYVPLVDVNNTIIGFGYVQSWTLKPDPTGATGGTLSVTLGPSGSVGFGNVSGAYVAGLPQDTTNFTTLFQEHAALSNPLYAPVLVNHYIGPNP